LSKENFSNLDKAAQKIKALKVNEAKVMSRIVVVNNAYNFGIDEPSGKLSHIDSINKELGREKS
jgi:hypothetical protein